MGNDKAKQSILLTIRNWSFFVTLLLFAMSLPFSESMISIQSGVVLLQALLFYRKSDHFIKDGALWLLVSVFFVYLAGCLKTNDQATALYELKKNLFWLTVPAGIALSPRLTEKQFWSVLLAFVLAVILSSFFSTGRLILSGSLQSAEFREAHFVSHISFSLQVNLALFILGYSLIYKPPVISVLRKPVLILGFIWLLCFSVVLKSMVGWVALYFTVLVIFIISYKKLPFKRWNLMVYAGLLLLFCLPILYVACVVFDFYQIKDTRPKQEIVYTANGRPYYFDFNDQSKENGHYVNWYLCEEELKAAWDQRSDIKFHQPDASGYPVHYTLIRYMTARGLKKDSAGVAALSDCDIDNIQHGIANPVFARSMFSVYPRVYETIWEVDHYYRTGNPSHQSFSQRLEYNKAAWLIIKDNPLLGIGTGNYKLAYRQALLTMGSKLPPELFNISHNQYLNYWVKFGLAGVVWILLCLYFAIVKTHQKKNLLLWSLLLIYLFANFGENNFETHVGLSGFLLFFSMFLWHSPEELKHQPDFRSW